MTKNIRNIALFAHVDAGKTTVSEQFLFHSGKIKVAGSVDKGNSQTDFLDVEKERGITVNSTILTFGWNDTQINLIDTPGHIDFSSETEKAIQAIDAAVVIVSALEGVQAQTESMIDLLRQYEKPFLIFINKIDRMGADTEDVLYDLKTDLGLNTFLTQGTEQEGDDRANISSNWTEQGYNSHSELIEQIVAEDEGLLDDYLNGKELSWKLLESKLLELVSQQKIYPVLLGSAKNSIGVVELLNAISNYLPAPQTKGNQDLCAVVFKTYYKKGEGKLSAVRIFSGDINSRDMLYNASKKLEEKVSTIKNTDIQNQKIIQVVSSGEIAWVQGLISSEPGDYLGYIPKFDVEVEKSKALLTVQVLPKEQKYINALIDALVILNNEDPDLQFEYLKEEQELHINIRGKVQEEILQSILLTRFGLEVNFSEPTVIYKETPTQVCEGYVRYWMPKPCWAIMKFRIEPAERGSGVHYSSKVGVNDVKRQYQNDVEKSIPFALKQGVLGWEVDDVNITLIEGEDHEAHTKSNDFAIATPMGIMDGLSKSESSLLEPILNFKLTAPETFLGALASELTKLRAEIQSHDIEYGKCKIQGTIPLATSVDFPIKLSSITSGKGKIFTRFFEYRLCDVALGKTRNYKGISPLDTAKYILKARKALV